ncbi:hypothetical protein BDF19DRAFT_439225 [Syncephalis fuscata]|nr:hypothetical protein BDF19DRAFT_439225 [Syncephalis fuscata]
MAVLYYRWRYGLFGGLYRRINNYWIPVPIDSFMICIIMGEFIRATKHTLVLLDWPKSMLFRDTMNMVVTVLDALGVAMLTVGIISHIPSTFTQRTQHYPMASAAQGYSESYLRILVPSTKYLFWISLCFFIQMVVINVSMGALVGWAKDHGVKSIASTAEKMEALCMAISILTIVIINCYYCYGFYRVLHAHVNKLQYSCSGRRDAARCYRNIFLAVAILFSASSLFAIMIGVFDRQIRSRTDLRIIIAVLQFSVVYPILALAILYNIWRTSQLQVHRNAVTTLATGSSKSPGPLLNGKQDYPTGTTAMTVTDIAGDCSGVMEPTLVWQTFISGNAPTNHDVTYLNYSTRAGETANDSLVNNYGVNYDSFINNNRIIC